MTKYISSKESAENPAGSSPAGTNASPHYTTETLYAGITPNNNPNYRGQQQQQQQSQSSSNKQTAWRFRRKNNRYNRLSCYFCHMGHPGIRCTAFPTATSRREKIIQEHQRCIKCMKSDHVDAKKCKVKPHCKYCSLDHHYVFCPSTFGTGITNANGKKGQGKQADSAQQTPTQQLTCNAMDGNKHVLLQTASVCAYNSEQRSLFSECSLILDSASQKTYITEELAQQLQLPRYGEEYVNILHFGSSVPTPTRTTKTKLSLKLINGSLLQISANIVPEISGPVKKAPIPPSIVKKLNGYTLADPINTGKQFMKIRILIGSDLYWSLLKPKTVKIDVNENI